MMDKIPARLRWRREIMALVTLGAILIGGCAQLPPFQAGSDEPRQVSALIADGQRVAKLAPEEQRRELAAASDAFARDRKTWNRLRLALLLSTPGSLLNDDARAASLLEPFAAPGAAATPLTQLGTLLQAQVAERLREQKRAQQLKEQIDALRAVDRSLIERAQARPK